MKRIIFIDRDGVINVDPIGDYIKRWEDFHFEEGSLEAMKELSHRGFSIIIISNQAGIGDGVYPESVLWDIHEKMMAVFKEKDISVEGAYYCLHGKNAGCRCRKPEVGLFERAAAKYQFKAEDTYFIGDKLSDIQAGKAFGLKTVFVRTGHGKLEEKLLKGRLVPDLNADNLSEAVKKLFS